RWADARVLNSNRLRQERVRPVRDQFTPAEVGNCRRGDDGYGANRDGGLAPLGLERFLRAHREVAKLVLFHVLPLGPFHTLKHSFAVISAGNIKLGTPLAAFTR